MIVLPALKWAGGKRSIAAEILAIAEGDGWRPGGGYVEPFVGGAAVFCALSPRPWRALLADVNAELVAFYVGVRDDVDRVAWIAKAWPTSEAQYYAVRELDPDRLDPAMRAARVLYLNRCSFNGLWRVNNGAMTTPWGRREGVRVVDVDRLRALSRALAGVEIVCGDFEAAIAAAHPGDLLYLDPPYLPPVGGDGFVAYAGAFGVRDHVRLELAARDARDRGVFVVASQGDTPRIREIWAAWQLRERSVKRSISRDASTRAPARELIFHGRA